MLSLWITSHCSYNSTASLILSNGGQFTLPIIISQLALHGQMAQIPYLSVQVLSAQPPDVLVPIQNGTYSICPEFESDCRHDMIVMGAVVFMRFYHRTTMLEIRVDQSCFPYCSIFGFVACQRTTQQQNYSIFVNCKREIKFLIP